jgi:hypothetical protein
MNKHEKPGAPREQFVLRFQSAGQRDALKERSKASLRTMNAEILYLIEAGIRAVDGERSTAVAK